MNEHRDDWLWDGSGAPDPEVQALQALLSRYGHDGRPFAQDRVPPRRAPRRRWPIVLLAAAALALAFVLSSDPFRRRDDNVLAPGAVARTFETKGDATEVRLGELAVVRLFPGTRLSFRHWQQEQALFQLEAGGFEARVKPPPSVQPRFFQVDTPLGRCIDQGCRYELRLLDNGGVRVEVIEGIVTFPVGDREAWIPAGAALTVPPGGGLAIPMFTDVAPMVKKLLAIATMQLKKQSPEEVRKSYKELCDACVAPGDSLILWHLLSDPDEEVRRMAEYCLLARRGPPPEGQLSKDETWDPQVWLAYLRRTAWQLAK